jgi:uncharacterized protein YidB (DUF937 family)
MTRWLATANFSKEDRPMGLLDSVIGGLMGGQGGSSPMAGVLMNLLGGGQGAGSGLGTQSIGRQGQGGLGGLLASFEQAGLGHIAQSWVGTGQNQQVTPDQLQRVFGQARVQSMADQAGMEPQGFLSQLAQHLPHVVDQMTPQGRVPDEGTVSV